jgi:hypothetical protein
VRNCENAMKTSVRIASQIRFTTEPLEYEAGVLTTTLLFRILYSVVRSNKKQ